MTPFRRSHQRPILLALALILPLLPFRARADASAEARAEAASAFQAGSAGDARAAARASALFQQLSAAEPGDPVLLAYAGAATALTGRDASSPLDALNITEAGLSRIDQALKRLGPADDRTAPGRLPQRLETWLVAASTFLAVPDDVFHRLGDAKAVLALALAHPAVPHAGPGVRAQLARLEARLARAEHRPQDELAALKKAAALDPSGPAAEATRARLAELSR